jgi:methyl-accepting chemotaxis protein
LFDYVTDITTLVEGDVQSVLRLKLIANSEGQNLIAKRYHADVTGYLVAFGAVLSLSLLVAWYLSSHIAAPIGKLSASLAQLASGNLNVAKVKSRGRDEIGVLCESFNTMLDSLRSIIGSVRETSRHVAVASETIHGGIKGNARAGEEIAQATGAISDAIYVQDEQMQTSVTEFEALFRAFRAMLLQAQRIEGNAGESLLLAGKGAAESEAFMAQFAGIAAVADRVEREGAQLEALVEEMSGVLSQISGIASETNILSLNAGIEAARVKDAMGANGFTVIAQRVKHLAGQTAVMAASIEESMTVVRERIKGIRREMSDSVSRLAAGRAGAEASRAAFEAIRDASEEMRSESMSIHADMRAADVGMNRILELVRETGARAGAVRREIESIAAMGEEQFATLQEVAASTDLLMSHIQDMNGAAHRFSA